MTDKELLMKYLEQELKSYISEDHKIYLVKEKMAHIDWWVNTKWGQDKIKEIKEATK